MVESEGIYSSNEARDRIRKLDRLAAKGIEEEEKIENGLDTSAAQLDRHLAADAAFYHFRALHAGHIRSKPSAREEMGIEYLKVQKVLHGSYYEEKADYCHEMYEFHRGKAEEGEQRLKAGEVTPGYEDEANQANAQSRKWAANWLRTEANCLEMPEPVPAAPPPKPPER